MATMGLRSGFAEVFPMVILCGEGEAGYGYTVRCVVCNLKPWIGIGLNAAEQPDPVQVGAGCLVFLRPQLTMTPGKAGRWSVSCLKVIK